MMPCSLVDKLQCFGELCYLHLQNTRFFFYSEDGGIRFLGNVEYIYQNKQCCIKDDHTLILASVGTTDVI
jgi:hypothetical protein